MAAKRFLDVGETAAALEKAGFSKNDASRVLMLFAVNDRVKASELNALLASAREIGPHNVYTFLGGGALFSAFRQLKKPGFKRHKEKASFGKDALIILRAFSRKIGLIIGNERLAANGYRAVLTDSFDYTSGMTIEAVRAGEASGIRFNFDLFFNRKGKPSAMLASMQGNQKQAVDAFKRALGESPLDFFVGAFRAAFPGQGRLVALNPKRHAYRRPLNYFAVANSMRNRGKLSDREFEIAVDRVEATALGEREAVHGKISTEMKRIKREATGMHMAAFRKAGFGRSRSRTWRKKA